MGYSSITIKMARIHSIVSLMVVLNVFAMMIQQDVRALVAPSMAHDAHPDSVKLVELYHSNAPRSLGAPSSQQVVTTETATEANRKDSNQTKIDPNDDVEQDAALLDSLAAKSLELHKGKEEDPDEPRILKLVGGGGLMIG